MKIDLWHGDCLELMRNIPDGSVDLVLTDPPYNTTKLKWDLLIPFEKMWAEIWRVLKPNGAALLFGAEPFSSKLRLSQPKFYKYDWYWHKTKSPNFLHARKMPHFKIETISVFYKKPPQYNSQKEKSFSKTKNKLSFDHPKTDHDIQITGSKSNLRYADDYSDEWNLASNIQKFCNKKSKKNNFHPTQKPVALLEYLIKTYTLEGETVLDFTMGSGSTGVAAKNLNRNFIGIELDETYFEIAKKRINDK